MRLDKSIHRHWRWLRCDHESRTYLDCVFNLWNDWHLRWCLPTSCYLRHFYYSRWIYKPCKKYANISQHHQILLFSFTYYKHRNKVKYSYPNDNHKNVNNCTIRSFVLINFCTNHKRLYNEHGNVIQPLCNFVIHFT